MTEEKGIFHRSYDAFWSLVLAGIFSLISFIVFLSFQTAASPTQQLNFYMAGWGFFVPLGLLLGFGAGKIRSGWLQDSEAFYPCAIPAHFIFVLYLLFPMGEKFVSGWIELLSFISLEICVLLTAKWIDTQKGKISQSMEKALWLLMSLFFAYFVLTHTLGTVTELQTSPLLHVVSCSLIVLALYGMLSRTFDSSSFSWGKEIPGYILALLFIFLVVVDPAYRFDRHHYSFYLGPLADMQGGKSLLVNINHQYGVLVFYFLSLFFKVIPLGFRSLCLVLTILFIAQYFLFYGITRKLFPSKLYSFFCLAALLLINYLATTDPATEYPSVGPLRFGFIYLLIASVIWRNEHPKHRPGAYFFESIVLGAALFWGFEVAVYTVPPYFGFLLYECLGRDGKSFRFKLAEWGRRMALLGGAILVLLALIYADVHHRTGEWPHWSYYFDYIFMYKNGFGMLTVPFFGGWWLIAGMLLLSFFIVLGSLLHFDGLKKLPHFNAITLLTFYGIFQFFYFLGRAHPNNLFYVSMPSILLGAYWLYWLRQAGFSFMPELVKKTVLLFAVLALGIYLTALIPAASKKMVEDLKYLPYLPADTVEAVRSDPEYADLVDDADELMTRYSGTQKELIYFLGEQDLDLSMATGRVNVYPYSDFLQASFCPPVGQRVLDFVPAIYKGEYVYWASPMKKSGLEQTLFERLNGAFVLKKIDEKGGVVVYQIVAHKKKSG